MTVVRSGAASHVGRVRTVNQDLALRTPSLFAVADGMGGHVGGEVAARVAVETLQTAFARQGTTGGLQQAVSEANAAVWTQGQDHVDLRGMGTTLTAAALVVGNDGRDLVALANVGDSRAYLFTAGRLTRITSDHSLAEEKVRYGELTEAEAAVHPHRHILTRALGVASTVDVDLWELHLRTGDRLLLCSDGLTNEVSEERITGVLSSVADPEAVARQLVDAANDHGGNDNITVVIVDVLIGDDEVATADVIEPRPGGPEVVAPLAVPPPASPAGAEELSGGTGPGLMAATPPVEPWVGAGAVAGGVSAVPAARAGATAADLLAPPPPLPPPPAAVAMPHRRAEPAPRAETRRERRRRLGVPRRITFRVVGFFLLLAAVVAAAYVFVRWYATDNWYVTTRGTELVVYQGRPGGLLWFEPKLVDRTGVTTAQVLPIHLQTLRGNVNEPSLAAARRYVATLRQEFFTQQQISNQTPPATAPSTAPSTTTTTAGGAP